MVWRNVTDFFVALRVASEAIGTAVIAGASLITAFGEFLGRHSGWWLVFPIGIGASVPATDGWGLLSNPPAWQTWPPVVGVPLVTIFIVAAFGTVNSDSDRQVREEEARHAEPETERELSVLHKQRQMTNQVLMAGDAPTGSPAANGIAFEDDPFVGDILSLVYLALVGSQGEDVIVAMLELDHGSFKMLANKGFIGDDLYKRLEMEWEDFLDPKRPPLDDELAPLGFRCKPFLFSLDERHYMLIGVSGTEFGDAQQVELSRAARDMVARYVFGENVPAWIEKRGEASA